ncbi:hypothetical protein V8C86DRAFT_1837094, partial [Haematococcus lacustris]
MSTPSPQPLLTPQLTPLYPSPPSSSPSPFLSQPQLPTTAEFNALITPPPTPHNSQWLENYPGLTPLTTSPSGLLHLPQSPSSPPYVPADPQLSPPSASHPFMAHPPSLHPFLYTTTFADNTHSATSSPSSVPFPAAVAKEGVLDTEVEQGGAQAAGPATWATQITRGVGGAAQGQARAADRPPTPAASRLLPLPSAPPDLSPNSAATTAMGHAIVALTLSGAGSGAASPQPDSQSHSLVPRPRPPFLLLPVAATTTTSKPNRSYTTSPVTPGPSSSSSQHPPPGESGWGGLVPHESGWLTQPAAAAAAPAAAAFDPDTPPHTSASQEFSNRQASGPMQVSSHKAADRSPAAQVGRQASSNCSNKHGWLPAENSLDAEWPPLLGEQAQGPWLLPLMGKGDSDMHSGPLLGLPGCSHEPDLVRSWQAGQAQKPTGPSSTSQISMHTFSAQGAHARTLARANTTHHRLHHTPSYRQPSPLACRSTSSVAVLQQLIPSHPSATDGSDVLFQPAQPQHLRSRLSISTMSILSGEPLSYTDWPLSSQLLPGGSGDGGDEADDKAARRETFSLTQLCADVEPENRDCEARAAHLAAHAQSEDTVLPFWQQSPTYNKSHQCADSTFQVPFPCSDSFLDPPLAPLDRNGLDVTAAQRRHATHLALRSRSSNRIHVTTSCNAPPLDVASPVLRAGLPPAFSAVSPAARLPPPTRVSASGSWAALRGDHSHLPRNSTISYGSPFPSQACLPPPTHPHSSNASMPSPDGTPSLNRCPSGLPRLMREVSRRSRTSASGSVGLERMFSAARASYNGRDSEFGAALGVIGRLLAERGDSITTSLEGGMYEPEIDVVDVVNDPVLPDVSLDIDLEEEIKLDSDKPLGCGSYGAVYS